MLRAPAAAGRVVQRSGYILTRRAGHDRLRYVKTTRTLCLTLIIVALVGLAEGCHTQVAKSRPRTPGSPTQTVAVTVDFGDGKERRLDSLPWGDRMTALEALQAASETPGGPKIESHGSGPTAFVEA